MIMKKRLITGCLIIVVCLSLSVSTFAFDEAHSDNMVIRNAALSGAYSPARIIFNGTQVISTSSGIELLVVYQFNESYNCFGSISFEVQKEPDGIKVENVIYAHKTTSTGEPYVLFTVYFYKNGVETYTYTETARLYKPI